jgi:cell division protein ZapA
VANTKGVTVKILAKDYQIACPEDQTHHLIDAAMMLDDRMKEIRNSGRVIGLERIAVMAALNLAHELLKLKSETQHMSDDTERRLLQLHDKIDDALAY